MVKDQVTRATWPHDPLPVISAAAGGRRPVFALDDDPTGTQTVRGVPVLTRWSESRLADLLASGPALVYLLTNSRSLPEELAVRLATSVGQTLRIAGQSTGCQMSVVSRSDSTLRGHFPAEVDALAEGLGIPDARVLLAPFFGDGGRLTVGGVHYLRRDGLDVPVAETEFARDPVFGYRSSDLREWVAERCQDAKRPVELVDLSTIRGGGPDAVQKALESLPPRGVLVSDAMEERDIEVVALGALRAELAGLPLIARTAASYVRARAGQRPASPLTDAEIHAGRPGLVMVGSHVPTTTAQLATLLAAPPAEVTPIELAVGSLVARPSDANGMATRLATLADHALRTGRTPIVHSSRELARGGDARDDLGIGALVSGTLVEVVRRIRERPAWVLAKGGITSSDVATMGLDVAEATVVGPLLPGVPTWRCGAGSRWPGMTYVVFPGNVGGPDALRAAVAKLVGAQ